LQLQDSGAPRQPGGGLASKGGGSFLKGRSGAQRAGTTASSSGRFVRFGADGRGGNAKVLCISGRAQQGEKVCRTDTCYLLCASFHCQLQQYTKSNFLQF
jgi:hypothetical protein